MFCACFDLCFCLSVSVFCLSSAVCLSGNQLGSIYFLSCSLPGVFRSLNVRLHPRNIPVDNSLPLFPWTVPPNISWIFPGTYRRTLSPDSSQLYPRQFIPRQFYPTTVFPCRTISRNISLDILRPDSSSGNSPIDQFPQHLYRHFPPGHSPSQAMVRLPG